MIKEHSMVDTIHEQIDALHKEAFALVKKLNSESYQCIWDQVADMKRVGALANAISTLSDARSNLYDFARVK